MSVDNTANEQLFVEMQFIQQTSRYDHKDKARHYQRTYEYRDENGDVQWNCDVFGSCISAPTVFAPQSEDREAFTMRAKGKFMNATYYLEDAGGDRFATITRKGVGFRWKVLAPDDTELVRAVDPASWKEAVVRDVLGGLPNSFAVIESKQFVARIAKEDLVEAAKTKPRNKLGRFLDKVFASRAMTLRVEDGQQLSVDTRILVAVMTLLQVHDITGAASSG